MGSDHSSSSSPWVKAAVMDAPGKMRVAQFPLPSVPDDAALLDVSLCGICGTDKHIYMDQVRSHPFGMPTRFPIIPGHEVVGSLEKIGDKASRRMNLTGAGGPLQPGDRVVPVVDLRCEECVGCKMHP